MKHCPACNTTKQDSEFSKNMNNLGGLATYCRTCNAAKQREWKRANPEKVKAWKKAYLARIREANQLL